MNDCPFCLTDASPKDEILSRNAYCVLLRSNDPVLQCSAMIIPERHVATPFELTPEEWMATHELLAVAKRLLDLERPDGYSVGWNVHAVGGQTVPHAHLHVIGRLADEPLAGTGIRHALKQPLNRRMTDVNGRGITTARHAPVPQEVV